MMRYDGQTSQFRVPVVPPGHTIAHKIENPTYPNLVYCLKL